MTLRSRLAALERRLPPAADALSDLLASIAAQGARIHDRGAPVRAAPPSGWPERLPDESADEFMARVLGPSQGARP